MIYLGIDPGKKGGVSWLSKRGEVFTIPMPAPEELSCLIKLWDKDPDYQIAHCYLEKAQAMPKQGVVSMFNYGEGAGILQGILLAHEVPYTLLAPRAWQTEMFTGTKKGEPKARALQAARRLFPKEKFLASDRCSKPHDGMIDSLLIAEYCRRRSQ